MTFELNAEFAPHIRYVEQHIRQQAIVSDEHVLVWHSTSVSYGDPNLKMFLRFSTPDDEVMFKVILHQHDDEYSILDIQASREKAELPL